MPQGEVATFFIHQKEGDCFKGNQALNLYSCFFKNSGDIVKLVDTVLKIAKGCCYFEGVNNESFDTFEMFDTFFKIRVGIVIYWIFHRHRSVQIRRPVVVRPVPS